MGGGAEPGMPVGATTAARATAGLPRDLLEAMLDVLPFAAVLVDPGEARVVFANRAADELAGGAFPVGGVADRRARMHHLTDAAGVPIPADRHPTVRAARGERLQRWPVEWHAPGGTRSVIVSSGPVPAGDECGPLALVAFEDVTPIRGAESDARAAEALLDAFFASAPLGLAFFDRELRYQRVNDALAGMHGVPAADHIGRTVRDIAPGRSPELVALMRSVVETAAPVRSEISGSAPGAAAGERRHWMAAFFPIRDAAEQVAGVGATFLDITDRVAAERRVGFLARAGEVLGRSLDFDTTLADVATLAVPELADWCFVDLLEEAGVVRRVAIANEDAELTRRAWEMSSRWPPALDAPGGLSTVLQTRAPNLVHEIDDAMLRAVARDADHLAALRELGFTSALSAPLVVRGRVIGALTFVFARTRRRPGAATVELASELAARAATAIDNARLYRDRDHIARTLQRSLLPPRLPHIEGFEIAARYRAAGEGNLVGGDFYDVFPRTGSSWIVALGDVCGKGPEAAAITALARYALRAAAIADGAPSTLMASLNDAILGEPGGNGPGDRYMTAVTGCLDVDPVNPMLTLGSAGHPPPVLVRAAGKAEALSIGGRALGLLPGLDIASCKVALEPGDALLLYTDGVLDAGAPRRPLEVGELVAAVEAVAGASAADMADAVERTALERAAGPPRDDIAIVVLRRAGGA